MTDLRALLAAAPGPLFRQGNLINGPDRGGLDIGPLLFDSFDPAYGALVVRLVNAAPLMLDEPTTWLLNITKSAARMGLCSQTHHEHLMVDAKHALDGYNAAQLSQAGRKEPSK